MEAQIHILEQEAYCAVLRAFKAQSDAISWEKESMITELRRELRVSDDEHRELLSNVHNDDIIKRIRDWRQGGVNQVVRHANNPPHDVLPSPAFSASRKKQKTFQSYPSIGSARNRSVSCAVPAEAFIGRKVWTKWPEDNSFYEAVVTQYNAAEGRHALVYDINTANETWEWVDLKEIPPEDIKWDGEENGVALNVGYGGGSRKALNNGGGRGRGPITQPRREHLAAQHGGGERKFLDEIELFNTESLVKEVERVFDSNLPDPHELDKAKKLLKEHEQALISAIARLADASEFESDGEEAYLHELPMHEG
uniref:ENT domain-containing protein n=1 Tax=Noccaea caerulescens TaxID=107243 RepID=A0A1J3CMR5_NOCCA